jgi:hypothetical protein
MARLAHEKLALLRKAFTEDAMSPDQVAQAAGVTYATGVITIYGPMRSSAAWKSRLLPSLENTCPSSPW